MVLFVLLIKFYSFLGVDVHVMVYRCIFVSTELQRTIHLTTQLMG